MKLPTNFKEAPLYFSPLFMVILSAFSLAYGIPLIVALVLVYLRHKKYRSIEMTELIQWGDIQEKISSEQQQKNILNVLLIITISIRNWKMIIKRKNFL